jgi:hypothetical protein
MQQIKFTNEQQKFIRECFSQLFLNGECYFHTSYFFKENKLDNTVFTLLDYSDLPEYIKDFVDKDLNTKNQED